MRCAWATYADSQSYLHAAAVLYRSLCETCTHHDFVVLVPHALEIDTIFPPGVIIRRVTPFNIKSTYHAHARYMACTNKIHCWMLLEYDKVCWLDTDMVVVHNIDHLFEVILPPDGIAAARGCLCNVFRNPSLRTSPESCPFVDGNNVYVNTGLFLLTPNANIANALMNASYDHPFAEQDAYNIFFRDKILTIDSTYNYLNHLPLIHPEVATNNIHVYHFGYGKPWESNILGHGHEYYQYWSRLKQQNDMA